jgi:DNA invertase Pin-like site-specific DNA recombinase
VDSPESATSTADTGFPASPSAIKTLRRSLTRSEAAGCARWFRDTASGSLTEQPQLMRALEKLRDGEDTVVSGGLDRLGRSLRHLIVSLAVTEIALGEVVSVLVLRPLAVRIGVTADV